MLERVDPNAFLRFAFLTDDSKGQEFYPEAQVLVLGVSGSGKSSVCYELARLNIFAANASIWPDCIGADVDALKTFVQRGSPLVIGLTCPFPIIVKRRKQAPKWSDDIERLGNGKYGEGERRQKDFAEANKAVVTANNLFDEISCTRIDVRNLTPREIANKIYILLPTPSRAMVKTNPRGLNPYVHT